MFPTLMLYHRAHIVSVPYPDMVLEPRPPAASWIAVTMPIRVDHEPRSNKMPLIGLEVTGIHSMVHA